MQDDEGRASADRREQSVVPVRIKRDGEWHTVDFHTLTDEELGEFAVERGLIEGWKWARKLAARLAGL